MSDGILPDASEILRVYNVSGAISTTTTTYLYSTSETVLTVMSSINKPDISPAASIGFAILILTTVIGNTIVLLALFLDKRLHSPSFFLIANMAIADLLLGLFVLPFSSVLELLDDRWIFGETLCSTWLALDVLCCTASIIGLMGVSIDRYIGVTRPLNYSRIMTIRRTIYLIIIVWAVSILTSVVPFLGLTDRGKQSKDRNSTDPRLDTCKINKNTFYTILSSMISFYIPVVILLILYSRVYQEAKKQGEKLENEKRRLYEIDYQILSKQAQEQQHENGCMTTNRIQSTQIDENNKNEFLSIHSNHDEECSLDRSLTVKDGEQMKKDYLNLKNNQEDIISHSESPAVCRKKCPARFVEKRPRSKVKRHSAFYSHSSHFAHRLSASEELAIIKRKLHNLKREKKAFRTVGLILGALLICWLPFFVTLPVISILKHHEIIKDENTENTWFKITFWLGYCNSALNPFVYAFSNRAIRRAFRQVIFRRCCCCSCLKKSNQYNERRCRRHRAYSGSFTTETSQAFPRQTNSFSADLNRSLTKTNHDHVDPSANSLIEKSNNEPVKLSITDFLTETGNNNEQSNEKNLNLILAS